MPEDVLSKSKRDELAKTKAWVLLDPITGKPSGEPQLMPAHTLKQLETMDKVKNSFTDSTGSKWAPWNGKVWWEV
jgi:hypothetical protein